MPLFTVDQWISNSLKKACDDIVRKLCVECAVNNFLEGVEDGVLWNADAENCVACKGTDSASSVSNSA